MRAALSTLTLFVAALVFGSVAEAQIYKVALKTGDSFETRYRPQTAPWDESKLVFLTDVGNSITLSRDEVEDITVDTETKGYGLMIDTTTILIGLAPNDALTPEAIAALEAERPFDPFAGLPEQRDYTMPMFREPGEPGGGIPAGAIFDPGPGPRLPRDEREPRQ